MVAKGRSIRESFIFMQKTSSEPFLLIGLILNENQFDMQLIEYFLAPLPEALKIYYQICAMVDEVFILTVEND